MNGYLHIISNYRISDNPVLCSIASVVGSVGFGLKASQSLLNSVINTKNV